MCHTGGTPAHLVRGPPRTGTPRTGTGQQRKDNERMELSENSRARAHDVTDRTPLLLAASKPNHPTKAPELNRRLPHASVADEWRAWPLSYLTWSWLTPLVHLGRARPLQQTDLGHLAAVDQCTRLADDLLRRFAARPATRSPNLHFWLCLAAMQYKNVIFGSISKEIGDILSFVGPLAVQGIVAFVSTKAAGGAVAQIAGLDVGFWWVILSAASSIFQSLALHHSYQAFIRAGFQSKQAVSLAIYRKIQKLSTAQLQTLGNGKIQNLMSTDANAVNLAWYYINYTWALVIQTAVCMFLLYSLLGMSALVALAVLVLLFPIQFLMSGAIGRLSTATLIYTDKRLRLVGELIGGIRLLKFFAYESIFADRVEVTRDEELVQKRRAAYVSAVNTAVVSFGPMLVALSTFLVYGVTASSPLTPGDAFSALALFSILRVPLSIVPMLVTTITAGNVSSARIAAFLSEPDMPEIRTVVSVDDTIDGNSDAISINATLRWTRLANGTSSSTAIEANAFALRDISLNIPAGQLTTVVGSVGSGKTALLSAILGDLSMEQNGSVVFSPPTSTSRTIPPIAYCAQQPWIMNATVRANIVLFEPFDRGKYDAVLHACALTHDLEILPAGDATEIGERGVNLSGGQKARIALARAVYSTCPIVLLDDVLSAVDAHVAAHIFWRAIRGPLLRHRTIIFVSHQLQFAPATDYIVVLDSGRVHAAGSYADVMNGDGVRASSSLIQADASSEAADMHIRVPRFANLLQTMMADRAVIEASLALAQQEAAPSEDAPYSPQIVSQNTPVVLDTRTLHRTVAASVVKIVKSSSSTSGAATSTAGERIIQDEDRNVGAVSLSVYGTYLKSAGSGTLSIILSSLVLSTCAALGTDLWLSAWSTGSGGYSLTIYMAVYGMLTGLAGLLVLAQSLAWARGGINAGRRLHSTMLRRIVRAPMSFFDTTPAGRIINRLSSDVTTVDTALPTAFSSFLVSALRILGTVVVQVAALPWILVGVLIAACITGYVVTLYRSAARDLKRLDAISRSPIFAHVGETLAGLTSIRSYQVQMNFEFEAQHRLDTNGIAFLKGQLLNRWLGIRLEVAATTLVAAVALASALAARSLSPGLVGLILSYSLTFTSMLNYGARYFTDTETALASVERIDHYSKLDVEKLAVIETSRPPPTWPSVGAIEIRGLTVRYRPELPAVLNRITVSIAGGEKVGIAGRTGSGKSSLMLALFRIIEAEAGCILIDGIDVSCIGLDDLRSKLAIIPQDPILFSGPVRYNLDPLGTASDLDIWEMLDRVGMRDCVSDLPGGLDASVEDGGANFSLGQRQLLSMARALLRKARILVLDEATASLDNISDAVLQRMLRSDALLGCTLLVIAHRVHTIADADKVLILDDGRVAEFDSPSNLLQRDSIFASLVAESTGAKAASG